MSCFLVSAALFAAVAICLASNDLGQFVIVSQPDHQRVSYGRITALSFSMESNPEKARQFQHQHIGVLLNNGTRGFDPMTRKSFPYVIRPEGVAVHRHSNRVFISDTGLRQIVYIQLTVTPEGYLRATLPPVVVRKGVNTTSIAFDGVGNLYWTDADQNRIVRLRVQCVHPVEASSLEEKTCVEDRLYYSPMTNQVSEPTGIFVDSGFVYWGNAADGRIDGSIVRASRFVQANEIDLPKVQIISRESEKVSGACGTARHTFYADGNSGNLYGVAKTSSPVVVVASSKSGKPWSCVWDEDNTVFFTDPIMGTVLAIPSGGSLSPRIVQKVTPDESFPGARGIGFYKVLQV